MVNVQHPSPVPSQNGVDHLAWSNAISRPTPTAAQSQPVDRDIALETAVHAVNASTAALTASRDEGKQGEMECSNDEITSSQADIHASLDPLDQRVSRIIARSDAIIAADFTRDRECAVVGEYARLLRSWMMAHVTGQYLIEYFGTFLARPKSADELPRWKEVLSICAGQSMDGRTTSEYSEFERDIRHFGSDVADLAELPYRKAHYHKAVDRDSYMVPVMRWLPVRWHQSAMEVYDTVRDALGDNPFTQFEQLYEQM